MDTQILLQTPVEARLQLTEQQVDQVCQLLAYTDRRHDYELGRLRQTLRRWRGPARAYMVERYGEDGYKAEVDAKVKAIRELEQLRDRTALEEDDDGLRVASGLAQRVGKALGVIPLRGYELPEPRLLPWAKPPKFKDRPYQVEAVTALVNAASRGPCGIELPTGAGKSVVIRNLLKFYGLSACVMAPSKSIAYQLLDDLTQHFGSKYVGLFGDGKKQSDKLFVVGIDDSLSRVELGSTHWDNLSRKDVFIADESHLTPASTLQQVCVRLMARAPYRFFVSATQTRTDGLETVLEGITGPIVYRKTLRELVDAGYLARPTFKMARVKTTSSFRSGDPNQMVAQHLYYSDAVAKAAAQLINAFADMQRPVLVLVEELEQFRHVARFVNHPCRFAHGPLSAKTRALVPPEHHAADPTGLVDDFNAGKFPVLFGTSCVATGTDIKAAEAVIYLMGGISEIKVAQAVGRGTRGGPNGTTVLNPWTGAQKQGVVFVDFQVEDDAFDDDQDAFAPYRHARARAEVYRALYEDPEVIDMSGGSW